MVVLSVSGARVGCVLPAALALLHRLCIGVRGPYSGPPSLSCVVWSDVQAIGCVLPGSVRSIARPHHAHMGGSVCLRRWLFFTYRLLLRPLAVDATMFPVNSWGDLSGGFLWGKYWGQYLWGKYLVVMLGFSIA
jgi:hypothetical protein